VAVSNPTLQTSGGNADTASAHVSATFTPTGNALLVVFTAGGVEGGTADSVAPTDTFTGSGSWTEVNNMTPVTDFDYAVWIMQLGALPGSGAVTTNFDENTIRTSWVILEVTGFDTTTPVSESGTATGTATSIAPSIADIVAGNLGFAGCLSVGDVSITDDADFTSVADASSNGGAAAARQSVVYDPDDNETVCTFSDLNTTENMAIYIEIAASAAGRIMSSLAGPGGLAGRGGIAGKGGGLAA